MLSSRVTNTSSGSPCSLRPGPAGCRSTPVAAHHLQRDEVGLNVRATAGASDESAGMLWYPRPCRAHQ